MNDPLPRRGPGRPPVSETAEGATRALILHHAQRLFQERGYSSVAMGDIAAAVGVTKPTLYYYFPHKEALYTAMVSGILERIGARFVEVMDLHTTVADRLGTLAQQGLVYASGHGRMNAMMHDVETHLPEAEQARIEEVFQAQLMAPLRRIMRDGIAAGELRPADPAWLAQVWFLLLDAFISSKQTPATPWLADRPALAGHLTHLFLAGAGTGGDRDTLNSAAPATKPPSLDTASEVSK